MGGFKACLIAATGAILLALGGAARGYDRDDYPHWIDSDGDGQDTRQEILIRDSQVPVTFRDDGKVETGLWVCPYTGRVARDPSDLDVDHLVALGEIDAAGASTWSLEQRTAFANDPDNLVAVYMGSNRSKGDRDAYLWLPPNIANCTWYLEARAAVWEKYGIEPDADERKSAAFFEDKCPLHEKGIKLNRVRRWLGTWFEGLF
jgi:hypothetical protein